MYEPSWPVIPVMSAFLGTVLPCSYTSMHVRDSVGLNEDLEGVTDMLVQQPGAIDRRAKVYIAGHAGLVGSAIWRHLQEQGFASLVGVRSSEVDLRDREATLAFFRRERPEVVIDAAAKVGGILANSTYPADFLSDNLRIQVNVMDAAKETGTERLLFLGSSCIYPKFAEQPIKESSLLTGALEPTNDTYAIAKIAGILQVQANRRQYGRRWISVMPTNLYGPNDNFDSQNSHVLPALIRRFHEAKESHASEVLLWGTGTPRREFLHVDDMAAASLFLLENYDSSETINVGVGEDVTIRELAEIVADIVGYGGTIAQDASKPDGALRKLLDVRRINDLGWKAKVPLRDGIAATYQWFLAHRAELRGVR
jgi:GDP-L-fucose synthase